MDLVVVSETRGLGVALGGPPVYLEGSGDWVLFTSLCLCVWVFGFCCGCACRRPSVGSGTAAARAPPAHLAPASRWARIAQRAINFVRSRRRLSLAFAHLGTYSLRNAPESKPNLRRRAVRRASTPGPILHEGPALHHGSDGDGAERHHGPGRRLHVGRRDRVLGSLRRALGDPARVRELALVPRPAWDTMASALQVPGAVDAEGNPGPLRDLTLVEQARIESTRRVALLRMGIPPDSQGTPGPPAAVPATGPGSPAAGGQPAAGSRRLKLSAVLDPTLDADVVSLGNLEIQKLYADYKAKFGDHPSAEADPSADQLASLRQVVAAGSVPYADFSLFGPHGLRLLRKQTFTSYTLNVATGEWSKKEQPGPSSYHSWVEAWKVYRTALLLLETVDAERLDAYAEHVRSFVTQFGDSAWWLVYRAENRLRCEHMERLRRTLHDKPAHGYTAARPWNAVFAAAVRDGDYWTRELVTPATPLALPASRAPFQPQPWRGRPAKHRPPCGGRGRCKPVSQEEVEEEAVRGRGPERQTGRGVREEPQGSQDLRRLQQGQVWLQEATKQVQGRLQPSV